MRMNMIINTQVPMSYVTVPMRTSFTDNTVVYRHRCCNNQLVLRSIIII